MYNKTYNTPRIKVAELAVSLLSASGPDATSIGSPSVRNNSKSVWDEDTEDNENIDYEI